MERLYRKAETAKRYLPEPVLHSVDGASIGIIGYGSTDPAIKEGRDRLIGEGIQTDYLRIRALPFTEQVEAFIREHERVYVIEMNSDGQMHMLLQLEVPDQATKLISLTHNNGMLLSANWVSEAIQAEIGGTHGG
jgi:2-oxoglutarate ferredoxin oxidoreductase subunit alpha